MILCVATMQVSGVGFGYLVIGYQSPDFLLQFIKLTYSYFLTMVASSLVPVIVCMVPEWREGLSQILSLTIVGNHMFYGIKIGNATYEFFQPTFANLEVVKDNSILLTIWEAEAILEATLAIFDIVMASVITNLLVDSGVLSRNFIGTLHYMNFWVVISLVARFYLLLFEADQLYGWETPLIHPIAVLILAWLRLMLIGAGGFVPQLICIERLFATFFIADYEKNGRSLYFNGVLAVNACAASVVIVGGMFLLAAHPELCTIASAVLFFAIQIATILLYFVLHSQNQQAWLWLEEQKARKGTSKPPLGLTHYGLSVRFQVKENLRVIRLLRRMVLFSFSLCMIGVTFGYSVLADRRGTVFIQTLALTYNLYLTIATSLMVPGLVAIVPEWRAQMIQAWISLFRCRKSAALAPTLVHKAPAVDTKLETQAYWSYYKSEW